MAEKKLRRRDFLKLTVTAAAVKGLSHFKFLNTGGLSAVSAHTDDAVHNLQEPCDPPGAPPDSCQIPGEPDFCIAPGEPDFCIIPDEPDFCQIPGTPDYCQTPGIPPDIEICDSFTPDICFPPVDPDICDPNDIPPDNNAVTILSTKATSGGMPVAGSVVALLTGAVLWIRHRLQGKETTED